MAFDAGARAAHAVDVCGFATAENPAGSASHSDHSGVKFCRSASSYSSPDNSAENTTRLASRSSHGAISAVH